MWIVMKMMKNRLLLIVMSVFTFLTSCVERDDTDLTPKTRTVTLNVDVILPQNIRMQWQNSIDWAQENIYKSQLKLSNQVKLNLRYHDENTENLDELAYRLTHPAQGDDTCHAIIGPYHSDNAMDVLKYARQKRLPVVMPTCTSAELQRINARNTYAWFLTESDLTQCEIMLSIAHAMDASDVALIYTDDTYGKSFNDWFPYFATEQELHLVAGGSTTYKAGDDLTDFLTHVALEADGENVFICVALSDSKDYYDVGGQVKHFLFGPPEEVSAPIIYLVYADTSLDEGFLNKWDYQSYFDYGVCPFGSMNYGFPQAYESRFGYRPHNGDAQIYDALSIIAAGAARMMASPDKCLIDGSPVVYYEKPYEPGLTDYMRSVVGSTKGLPTEWDVNGLAAAFSEIAAGRDIDMDGATGNLFFDRDSHTKILNTTYMIWSINPEQNFYKQQVFPLLYLSTSGSDTDASTTQFWQLEKRWKQQFESDDVSHNLGQVQDRWAVVISPSTTWGNYRHQADAFAMYQMLKNHGYDDDHIVLIVEDNLADDSRNVFPGEIFVERSSDPGNTDILVNENVHKDAVVDYHFTQLEPDDLADIMMGRSSERLPHVIHPTDKSNVLFFWSGHGGYREGPLWGNEDASIYFGAERIKNIVTRMNEQDMYRRMMFAIETCYSGKWGQALTGLPDVLVLTAANPNETSKADVHDRDLGVYLSNAFARTFRREVNANNNITVYELYKQLSRTTTGSHVTIYNNSNYGSVYDETMSEFLPD